ncbi:Zinc finger CCCH domain-containing protein 32 [Dichanthelium oligosanthes]|uniref:Zinc finger CCCH domain-containing protein 32 n=1 Tax=Dichanthelium oligosanthes TaxID=888268 RepID=A0A1E5W5W1_9POAL|nr:Zinc finger CCCH domain-containing protein 32 [Dichanthelium oligosanthes]
MEVDGAAEAGAAAAAGGAKPLTPEEEALRRSTDCVYFLASPLTCKKGNECDFRHSEGARMNPRDCWYWVNGSCLNPKCSFRHPPIDGLFGAPTPGIPPVSSHYGAYNPGKQMVPCYYFQKGNCLKGDRCPFYHGPQAAGNNPTEQVAKVSSFPLEPPQAKKIEEPSAPNISTQQGARIIDDRTMIHVAKSGVGAIPAELAPNAVKSRPNSEQAPNNTSAVKKNFTTEEHHPMHYQNQVPVEGDSVQDWNENFQMPLTDDLPQNSREADDFLGESSPGFDVLVDNDADGAAYLHDEEDFGGDMYPVEDYEYAPADFDIRAHHEGEQFNGMGESGQIGLYDGYERKRRRSSSERSIDRPFHSDRRFLHRGLDRDEIDGSDLRHQLRRRRINGPSTAISPERANGGRHWRDERYRERAHGAHYTHRDRHQGPQGSTLSSRLQARIKLPGRSPDRVDTCFEDERDRRRLRERFSPVRRTDFHGGRHREPGQHQERSHRRSSELVSSVRHADGLSFRRDAVDSVRFAARRNLGEPRKANGIVESEASLDFEGPKPLSVILQRKREAAGGNNSSSSYEKSAEVAAMQTDSMVESEKKGRNNIIRSEKSGSGDEEYKEEDHIPVEGHGQSLSHGDKFEVEDAAEVDAEGNQEADNYDQRDGESDDYEAIEGHDYKSEDENAYQDDEDFDDDDDFAQKVGVVFS